MISQERCQLPSIRELGLGLPYRESRLLTAKHDIGRDLQSNSTMLGSRHSNSLPLQTPCKLDDVSRHVVFGYRPSSPIPAPVHRVEFYLASAFFENESVPPEDRHSVELIPSFQSEHDPVRILPLVVHMFWLRETDRFCVEPY
jgi:hypothetical protein